MIYRHINDENDDDENDDLTVYNGGDEKYDGGDDNDQQVEGNEYGAHNKDSGELFILIIACCVVS
jgi:hypothetical protein